MWYRYGGVTVCALLLVLASGCRLLGDDDCTTVGAPSVGVQVVDAVTSVPLTTGVVVQLFGPNGDIDERTEPGAGSVPPTYYVGTSNKPGLYRVVVRSTGYQEATRENVRVAEATCGIGRTTGLVVPMSRAN